MTFASGCTVIFRDENQSHFGVQIATKKSKVKQSCKWNTGHETFRLAPDFIKNYLHHSYASRMLMNASIKLHNIVNIFFDDRASE